MKKSKDIKAFNIISYTVISIVALVCLIPFLMVIIGSFTAESEIVANGFSFFPKELSIEAYKTALKEPIAILKAYGVTASLTVIGTAIGLFIVAMTAYVLQRKDFKWRNKVSFFFYFTTLFSGGLVPWYILMVKYLGLKDSYLSLLLPPMLSVFNIIIMKSYMGGIPQALTESAKIDGAGDFTIFVKIILPLAKPALATIGMMIALGYWNDWYNSMLFINNENLYSLQYYLYKIVNNIEAYKTILAQAGGGTSLGSTINMPSESLKMALTIIVTGPIILVYPFIQKYFVSGVTIGAVKG
ncbi:MULTISPECIES: carbohydrate ABC transporter permease [unclassified Clostridium]|uniref:carbohydrate ABC transporter permease n=1 Tax=Clostridium TaxID=1485 RepID=UPI001C8C3F17|nr:MULTISPECIES: carbohydrate ABC transporter permease [unclassified Clostridium]MBX9138332.1 carbohydrate ABC transporter permease [Clostridium sp. K12(2020)]MBX9145008.1 carbohydrate ABC transporter permease [Clostridium sp. K13]MDU2291647.1 carbohydrate ABC transporter permease [Clostridium celatum]MDU4324905.1 carbohydrate ABC transporter permease [Clostridium celatum]